MFARLLAAAVIAGVAAGLLVTAAQALRVTPLIYRAEIFETQASGKRPDDHGKPAAGAPAGRIARLAFTALANLVIGVGFALLLAAGIALSGVGVDWKRGLLWGLAGFAAFALAPALGLPPDPPGAEAGPGRARQLWWLMAAAGTALGLWLIVFARPLAWKALGVVALVLPHAIGAPGSGAHAGPVPAALADAFVVASLATTAVFWLVLGALLGFAYRRIVDRPGR